MADNNQGRTQTSTQIRNFYSDGMACLNTKFFNTNFSFQFYPFTGRDQNGKSNYDMKHGETTTINFEGAFALWFEANSIINGTTTEVDLPIPCGSGASLKLERKLNSNGQYETILSITKNNRKIDFKFNVIQKQVKENNQIVTKTIESGLGALVKTIDGYLTGINADRHLDKLTDDYVKSLDQNKNNQNGNFNNYNKKSYNGGFKNQNHGYNNRSNQNWNQNQQNMSSYNIQN